MKKLVLLIAIVISNLTAFSQKGTDTIPIKQFPIPVVKMIIKDLLSGDSARKQLILTNQQLSQTEKLVSLKDSIINNLEIKEIGSQKIISLERDKFFVLTDHTKEVEKDLKKEKIKSKIFRTLTIITTTIVGVLIITK